MGEQCERVGDKGLYHISQISTLCELNVGSCRLISDIGLLYLSKLSGLYTLKISCIAVNDAGLRHLSSKLISLKEIDIGYCRNITNAGLSELCKLPNLKTIWLKDCPNINVKEITEYPRINFLAKRNYWGGSKTNFLLDFLLTFDALDNL